MRSILILCIGAVSVAGLPAQETPPKPNPDRKDDRVSMKSEVGVLVELLGRRLALEHLRGGKETLEKALEGRHPVSVNNVKGLVSNTRRANDLDYHYLERIRNGERRILAQLRLDTFRSLPELLEATDGISYPQSAVLAPLLNAVVTNFDHARRQGLVSEDAWDAEIVRKLRAERVRIQGTAGHSMKDMAKALYGDPSAAVPVEAFDPASGPISYEFPPVPPTPAFPLVDLNVAPRENLLALPGLEPESVDAIVAHREERSFQGPEELRLLAEIPADVAAALETICTASHQIRKKKWTIMVYLNAANNLEPFGIEDMNEMEKIGSTRDVNVVVECARFMGRPTEAASNGMYFSNPFAERQRQFYFGLDNTPGTRRYYILKDDDDLRVRSVLKNVAGETDAGRPEFLTQFGQWAVENFPAEHYALVIWNHGAGWSGISSDDNTHNTLTVPEVRVALEGIQEALRPQGKQKIDIVDMDACLMATLEVAYELKETADFLLASQEVEPGDGMPYDETLRWITTFPEAEPVSAAKAMVEAYVRSYAPEGSQAGNGFWGGETKSAIRLAAIDGLKAAVETLAASLAASSEEILGDTAEAIVSDTRSFGRLVDIHDFADRIARHEKATDAIKAAAAAVKSAIGYPKSGSDARLTNEVIVRRRSAGDVIWGWNDWLAPPGNLAPFIHEARHARTPLVGPDPKGWYVARLRFSPQLTHPKTGKPEWVKEINYRFADDKERHTVKDFENQHVVYDFGAESPLVAEGHLRSSSRSHGLSLYFPAYLGFDKEYRHLRFAQGSEWARLCETFPLKKLPKAEAVALLGISHVTKPMRQALGQIVVKDAFDDTMQDFAFHEAWSKDLKALEVGHAHVDDPRVYGHDWLGVLQELQGSVVIVDNTLGTPPPKNSGRGRTPPVGPETRALARYLGGSGRLLLGTPDVTASVWDTPLYRDVLGLCYGGRSNRSYELSVAGSDEPITVEPSRKGETLRWFTGQQGVDPFVTLTSGEMVGARIRRTHPETGAPFRAVVLGFHPMDIPKEESRRRFVKACLDFLQQPDSPAVTEGPNFRPSTPAGDPEVKPASSHGGHR